MSARALRLTPTEQRILDRYRHLDPRRQRFIRETVRIFSKVQAEQAKAEKAR